MARIVYISNSAIPSRTANSIHVMKMCHALARHGHDVTLIAPDKYKEYEKGSNGMFEYYAVQENFNVEKLAWWYGIKGKSYLYGLTSALRSLRLGPALVYSRLVSGACIAATLRLPVIFESHAPVRQQDRLEYFLFTRLITSNRLRRIVVITDSLRRYYMEHFELDETGILVAPDGADPLSVEAQTAGLRGRMGALQIGYVGHLYRGKGMEVVRELADACPWGDFHVVGGSSDAIASWQAKCEGLANLHFCGYVPHCKVGNYLKAFDVVLLPNQRSVEGYGGGGSDIGEWMSPLKLFEYMSAGRPIISSNVQALREILKHDVNALLCDPESIDQWAAELVRLRDDGELRLRLGQRAHADFIAHYTWEARAGRVVDLL